MPRDLEYGALKITCNRGCGWMGDPHLCAVGELLQETIWETLWGKSPARLPNQVFYPKSPWTATSEGLRWEAFDCEKTGGFCLEEKWEDSEEELEQNQEDIFGRQYSAETYSQFLELVAALKRDIRFYYIDVWHIEHAAYLSKLQLLEKEYSLNPHRSVNYIGRHDIEFSNFYWSSDSKLEDVITSMKERVECIEKEILVACYDEYNEAMDQVDAMTEKAERFYRDLFLECLEEHQIEGIAFRSALEECLSGEFDEAIKRIRWMLEVAENENSGDALLAKLHLLQGQVESEFGCYADAIVSLTASIQKDPSLKESYFERAVAYFELGEFDLAVGDYLSSETFSKQTFEPSQLATGVASGICLGIVDSVTEFVPSILASLRGLGHGLWALAQHPVSASQEFVNAAAQCLEYLSSTSITEISQTIVPELRELLQNYKKLEDHQKGKQIGYIIGKYGLDLFLAKESSVAIKAYRNLKRANQAMTLEALATPESAQAILKESGKRWVAREQMLTKLPQLEKGISDWLGEGAQCIRNKAGDPIFISQDGLRKARFDFIRPDPHESPHMHFEKFVNGKWQEISRVYPIDVPHK
ncbi:MAG: tetratricopeptide repeat protein [Verrucomicrobiota bacterium]|nr:tetratricopeptide repeat protein [Verrucomicrobiota bacterium]